MLSLSILFLVAASAQASPSKHTVCSAGKALHGQTVCDCALAPLADWVDGDANAGWPAVSHVSSPGSSVAATVTDTCFEVDRYVNDTDIPDATDRHDAGQIAAARAHQAAAHADTLHGGTHAFDISFDGARVCTSTELMSMDGGEAYRILPVTFGAIDSDDLSTYAVYDQDGATLAKFNTAGAVPVRVDHWPYNDDEDWDLVITLEKDVQWWIEGPLDADEVAEPPEE